MGQERSPPPGSTVQASCRGSEPERSAAGRSSSGGSPTRRSFLRRAGATVGGLSVVGSSVLSGCLTGPPDAVTVEMTDDLRFDPADARVAVGGRVTWENVGTVPHTVTAEDGGIPQGATYFASGGFDSESAARADLGGGYVRGGERYRHRFETAGRYEYICLPHEGSGMVGTVRVG